MNWQRKYMLCLFHDRHRILLRLRHDVGVGFIIGKVSRFASGDLRIFRGRVTGDLPEGAVKTAHILKAAGEGDLHDRCIGAREEIGGESDADRVQIPDKAGPGELFEHSGKMAGGKVHFFGSHLERDIFGGVFFHVGEKILEIFQHGNTAVLPDTAAVHRHNAQEPEPEILQRCPDNILIVGLFF